MTRTQLLALTTALLASVAMQASAQGATKMSLKPDSKVTVAGSSNVHDWACNSSAFDAAIELDDSYAKPFVSLARPIAKVSVTIPVKSLKCGKGKMDDNLYKALKADEFKTITYVLDTYELNKDGTTADAFTARTTGDLTIAGVTKKVEIPLTADRLPNGGMKGVGTAKLLMTDFGIKPPVALLGTLRTKNEIEVTFTVLLDKSAVVAITER